MSFKSPREQYVKIHKVHLEKMELFAIWKYELCTGTIFASATHITWNIQGPRLNIKTVLSTYGDFHVKDKTAVRTSYL